MQKMPTKPYVLLYGFAYFTEHQKKLYINHMLSVLELQDFARTCATAQTRDLMFCFHDFNKC